MNKNLYISWLSSKIGTNKTDELVINEKKTSKKHLKQEVNFLRTMLATHIHQQGRQGEIGSKGIDDDESYTLEPKSGLIDYRPDAPRASTKQPYVPPIWSYLGRNSLGINSLGIRENNDIEEGALAVIPKTALAVKPTTALAVKPKPVTRSDALAVIAKKGNSNTALATKPKSNTGIIPHSYPTRRVPSNSDLATTPPKGGLPIKSPKGGLPIKSSTGGSLIKPPVKPSEDPDVKPLTPMSGTLTNPPINNRDKSKWTRSIQPRSGGRAPFSVQPGTGDIVSESAMSSLINHHIDKFLNSRHGKLLKNEAQKVLTNRN